MSEKLILIVIAITIIASFNFVGQAGGQDLTPMVSPADLACKDCNLIIISLTNTRKDHLGIYGYKRNTSPNIDEFFKNSMVLENAFAPASWTLPDAASFFTSLFPYEHNIMSRFAGTRLKDDVKTLPAILKANGYVTAAFTGDGDYNRTFNLDQGFDVFADGSNYTDFGIDLPAGQQGLRYNSIRQVIEPAVEWMKKNMDRKFFLFLQGYDNHCPFTPTPPFDKVFDPDYQNSGIDYKRCLWTFEQAKPVYRDGMRYWPVKITPGRLGKSPSAGQALTDVLLSDRDVYHLIALYDGAIAQNDSYLKDVLGFIEGSGLTRNTLVVFMSEHGDLFGEHGRFMRNGVRGGTFYDPVLNFPFLLRHPKISSQTRTQELVQTVDLLPTLAEMLQIKDPDYKKRAGKSAVPAIIHGKSLNDYVYGGSDFKAFDTLFSGGLSASRYIRNKDWKLINDVIYGANGKTKQFESYELYKISTDPKEEKDLFSSEDAVAVDLMKKLNTWLKSQKKATSPLQ